MMYATVFGIALLLNVIVTFRSSSWWQKCRSNSNDPSSTDSSLEKKRHSSLLRIYLVVYLLATLSDWLQGPYVYALYDAYGYSQHDIAVLFVAGFGSSMVFGSFVGGMADWGGRRRFVVLFCAIYAASCITKHFKDYNILMLGRLLGGIATSLLFSVFDAWLIRAHADAKISSYLSQSFSSAAYGNSIIAIVAGLLANKAANYSPMVPLVGDAAENEMTIGTNEDTEALVYIGGYLSPFDIALVALCVCGSLACTLWDENYGEASSDEGASDDGRHQQHWHDGLKNAFDTTMRNRDVFLCGLVSSLFEGSMYVFVFMWTPALKVLTAFSTDDEEPTLPFGLIFSTFMVCCMAGSSLFSILIPHIKGEALGVFVFGVSTVAMAAVAMASSDLVAFLSMNLFEVCVGMYFPIMGTLKGTIVPEDKRAAIYNLYRIPLNFIVLLALLTDLTPTQSFACNTIMLSTATVLQINLTKRRRLYQQLEQQQQTSTKEETELTVGLVHSSSQEEERIDTV